MTRRRDALYAGAVGRATLLDAARASRRFAVQPKLDGWFVTLTTASDGRVSNLITRAGVSVPAAVAREFSGVTWIPDSVLAVELEVGEAANRVSAIRGYRVAWAFDALRVAGQDVSSLPYGQRRDWLMRAESWLVGEDRDRPWTEDRVGRAHCPLTGRWIRPVPGGWRRVRVVPQTPARLAERSWGDWMASTEMPVEGAVLVNLDSKLGARGAKRKIKQADTLDAVVLKVDRGGLVVHWTAAGKVFAVGHRKGIEATEGAIVAVEHESFYADGTPKFVRLARRRRDLEGARP